MVGSAATVEATPARSSQVRWVWAAPVATIRTLSHMTAVMVAVPLASLPTMASPMPVVLSEEAAEVAWWAATVGSP